VEDFELRFLLEEMLFRLKTLGCTNVVQTKCDSIETIENIESQFGGASRDRTDDLIVANDVVTEFPPTLSITCPLKTPFNWNGIGT